jgi:hypothetical protein
MNASRLALLPLLFTVACAADGDGQVLGPRGGAVESTDGLVTLEVPEGSVREEIEVESRAPEALPEGAVGPAWTFGPVGTGLAHGGTVRIRLEADEMELAGLHLVAWRDGTWVALPEQELDLDGLTISGVATYLSTFAVVAEDDDDGLPPHGD